MNNKSIINNSYSGIEKTEHTVKAKISFLINLYSFLLTQKKTPMRC